MGPKRPEHQAPPEVFYNETEARKYTENSRIIEIQTTMSERAVELLALPDEPCLLLDLGCGSGLSGSVLEDSGHVWVGLDISQSMLDVAKDRVTQGDLVLNDLGQGVPFRAGTFDGAISISALQWLCNRDRHYEFPVKRLYKFFSTLYAALNRTARVALQFYPENTAQIEIITSQAMRAGFFGGVVIDYPNSTKAKKFFLVLRTGGAFAIPTPMGVGEHDKDEVNFTSKSAINIWKNVAGRPVSLKSVIQPLLHPTGRTVTTEKSKDMTDLLKFIPGIKHGYYKTLKDKSTGWELKYGERR